MTLDSRPYQLGAAQVFPDRREIRAAGRVEALSPKAFQVLTILAEHAPQTVARATIMDRVWPHQVVGDEVLFKAISELRSAFSDPARKPQFIATVPRRGYRLLQEPSLAAARITGFRWVSALALVVAVAAIGSSFSRTQTELPHPNVQRARYVLDRPHDEQTAEKARSWLEEAVAEQPDDALAHTLLAEALMALGRHAEAHESAVAALARAPSSLRALMVRGRVALEFEWDLALCDSILTRAERLNSDIATVAVARAAWYAAIGEIERSIASIERALTADPVHPVAHGDLALYYYLANRPQDVIAQVAAFRELQSDTPFMQALDATARLSTAESPPERQALREALVAIGLSHDAADTIAVMDGNARIRRYAEIRLGLLADYSLQPLAAAGWLVQTGDHAVALALIAEVINSRSPYVPFLRIDPRFAPLREDPVFWTLYPVKSEPAMAQGEHRLVFR